MPLGSAVSGLDRAAAQRLLPRHRIRMPPRDRRRAPSRPHARSPPVRHSGPAGLRVDQRLQRGLQPRVEFGGRLTATPGRPHPPHRLDAILGLPHPFRDHVRVHPDRLWRLTTMGRLPVQPQRLDRTPREGSVNLALTTTTGLQRVPGSAQVAIRSGRRAAAQATTWSSIVSSDCRWNSAGSQVVPSPKSVNSESATCDFTSATCSSPITSRRCSTARTPP